MRSSSENVQWLGAPHKFLNMKSLNQRTVAQHQECFLKHLLKLPVIRSPLCSTFIYITDASLHSPANFLSITGRYVSLQFQKLWP